MSVKAERSDGEMKKVTINIPDDFADVISITVIGGAGTRCVNVKASAFDISETKDEYEIDIMEGLIKNECI